MSAILGLEQPSSEHWSLFLKMTDALDLAVTYHDSEVITAQATLPNMMQLLLNYVQQLKALMSPGMALYCSTDNNKQNI